MINEVDLEFFYVSERFDELLIPYSVHYILDFECSHGLAHSKLVSLSLTKILANCM
jgi:hypothetical protein